ADQNDFRQTGFLHAAIMKTFVEGSSRDSEVTSISVDRPARPVGASAAAEVRHAEQVPTNAQIQRETRADLPVVFEEEVELILMILANLASRVFRLSRMAIGLFVADELRIGGLPSFESHRRACNRSGERQEEVLGKRDVVRE